MNSAAVEGTVTDLRAIVEHRDDLVKTRTQTVNRLHVVLTNLIPGKTYVLRSGWAQRELAQAFAVSR